MDDLALEQYSEIAARVVTVRLTVEQATSLLAAGEIIAPGVGDAPLVGAVAVLQAALIEDGEKFRGEGMGAPGTDTVH